MIFGKEPIKSGKHMNYIYICTIHSFEREREREAFSIIITGLV